MGYPAQQCPAENHTASPLRTHPCQSQAVPERDRSTEGDKVRSAMLVPDKSHRPGPGSMPAGTALDQQSTEWAPHFGQPNMTP